MNQQFNSLLKASLPLACSFSLLVACGPSPTTSTPTTSDNVKVTASVAIGDTLEGTLTFADGSSEKFSLTIKGTRYQDVLAQLGTLTSCASFNVREITNGNGQIDAGDTFAVTLTGTPKNAAGTKTISKVTITGGGAATKLGIPANFTITPTGTGDSCATTPVSPEPTATATATPTPTPVPTSNTPSATPSATASATATPTASATTNASATSDISVVEKTTFNGKVFDDTGAPLDGVTIRAKSLNSAVPFDATTTTSGGSYAFNDAPSGVQIEIGASRSGYTSRRRVEVLKSNKNGDPNANRYDFGTDCVSFVVAAVGPVCNSSFGVSYNALSDKPEVIAVTPGRNASGIDYKTSFVMKFSEPMDKATVQDNFEVKSFNNKKFTVDTSAAAQTVSGPGDVDNITGTRIWDKAAFNVSWNTAEDEATFTFKEERVLPTDRDSAKTPDYQVALNRQDGAIKDKTGISRGTSDKKFKLTDGDFERSYKFSIKIDEKKPTVDGLVAQTGENSGANSDGDVIKVRFSERMIHYTLGPTIAGGMGGVISQAAGANNALTGNQVAPNYKVTIIRQAVTQMNQTTWSNLAGRAIFDTNDPTHKTVLLLPPVYTGTSANNVYLNNQFLVSAAGSYLTDGNSPFGQGYFFNLIRAGGNPVPIANLHPSNSLANNTTFAADLQNKLNAAANGKVPAPSTNPFTVTASAPTNGTITIVFNDTSGNYIGVNNTSRPNPENTDVFPAFNLGGVTLTQNSPIDIYRPGDSVNVKVDTTVLDPAGNSVDSSGDNASGNAS